MKTIKLTDKQLDIMKTALSDYIYDWEISLEGSKNNSYRNEDVDKKVARNIKSAKNILEKFEDGPITTLKKLSESSDKF